MFLPDAVLFGVTREMHRIVTLGWAVFALSACNRVSGSSDGVPVLELDQPPLVAIAVTLAHPVSPENDGWGFAFPVDIALDGDDLLVLENGNSRIVVFDRAYRAERTIGGDGAGPGEMRGVLRMDARAGRYAVSEVTNKRISVFDSKGGFVRSVPVEDGSKPFALGPDGTLYTNSTSPEHYLLVIDRAGGRRPFARRRTDRYPAPLLEGGRRSRRLADNLVAVTDDARVFLYDPVLTAVLEFDRGGRLVREIRLSRRIRDALLEGLRRVYADFGDTRPVYRAPASDLVITPDGDLLLLFGSVDGTFGLLVDPATLAGRALTWSPESEQATRGIGGAQGVIRDGRFLQVWGDNVHIFSLGPPG